MKKAIFLNDMGKTYRNDSDDVRHRPKHDTKKKKRGNQRKQNKEPSYNTTEEKVNKALDDWYDNDLDEDFEKFRKKR
tara:strand:- start:1854 stop:2084 length:231 start_codon:yes stop_codon:yes gene_type:complete